MAEGARLEIVCTVRYRGFESLSLLWVAGDVGRLATSASPRAISPVAVQDVKFGIARERSLCQKICVPSGGTLANPARPGREQR